jgi:hypothetical protein
MPLIEATIVDLKRPSIELNQGHGAGTVALYAYLKQRLSLPFHIRILFCLGAEAANPD